MNVTSLSERIPATKRSDFDNRRKFLSLLNKLHRNRIHAMPRILRSKSFAFEYMTQVTFAIRTNNFNAAAIGIHMLVYRARNLIIKARPAAAGFKFICGLVKRLIALSADVGAGHFVVLVFTGARPLGSFVEDDVLLFFG